MTIYPNGTTPPSHSLIDIGILFRDKSLASNQLRPRWYCSMIQDPGVTGKTYPCQRSHRKIISHPPLAITVCGNDREQPNQAMAFQMDNLTACPHSHTCHRVSTTAALTHEITESSISLPILHRGGFLRITQRR